MMRGRTWLAAAAAGLAALAGAAPPATAAQVAQEERFVTSDGVALQTTIRGEAPLRARPTIVEFSPYGNDSGTFDAGPAYNHLLVQIRGTGDSHGRFDALGPRTQADVVEVLRWACRRPWSTGRLGLNGFSASAITIYNSLHHKLPCVKTAVLKSGTHELYRDLLSPGGISNIVPGIGVIGMIGTPALAQGHERDPRTAPDAISGLVDAGLSVLAHPRLDGWWRERGFRGDVNDLPVLVVNGFYDVESRGAFEGYQELRDDGAHLLVVGAHDGAPAGTDAGAGDMKRWFDRYLRRVRNGVEHEPRVKLWMSDGDREDHLAGAVVRRDADDWPVPGTRWQPLALSPQRSGSARSSNDGSLVTAPPATTARQSYATLPSLPTATDPPNAAILGAAGLNAITRALPVLTDMTLAEPLGLTYTTPPLDRDVESAGPASLELRLSSTAPRTGIWAVVSDVAPDGTAHPVASGRLASDFPHVDPERSRRDDEGNVVQPYGRFDTRDPARPGQERLYRVELWPIGNRFRRGHRIRLHVLGQSLASMPEVPAINTATVGGSSGSRLLLPVLP